MRKIIVTVHSTLDGIMSGPTDDEDNIVSWAMPGIQDTTQIVQDSFDSVDTILLGRVTYEGLAQEKTKITSVKDGVNFLGFHIRQFKGRCYTFPQKEKVRPFLAEIRAWLKANISAKPEAVIRKLNPAGKGSGKCV